MNLKLYILSCLVFSFQSIVFESCSEPGQLAMTFDGGPSPYTGNLLNILSTNDVKAAFHLSGDYLNTPYISAYVKQAAKDGHLIGMMSKLDLFKVNADNGTFYDDITKLQDKIEKVASVRPTFLRIPYNAEPYPKDIVEKLESMGLTITVQNLDSQDYLYAKSAGDKDSIFQAYKRQIDVIVPPSRGAFISAQHDVIAPSVEQTEKIINYVKDKGYSITRLDICVNKAESVGKSKSSDDKSKDDKKGKDKNKNSEEDGKGKESKPNVKAKNSGSIPSAIFNPIFLAFIATLVWV